MPLQNKPTTIITNGRFAAIEDQGGWHTRFNGLIIREGYDKDTAEAVAFRLQEVLEDA